MHNGSRKFYRREGAEGLKSFHRRARRHGNRRRTNPAAHGCIHAAPRRQPQASGPATCPPRRATTTAEWRSPNTANESGADTRRQHWLPYHLLVGRDKRVVQAPANPLLYGLSAAIAGALHCRAADRADHAPRTHDARLQHSPNCSLRSSTAICSTGCPPTSTKMNSIRCRAPSTACSIKSSSW